MPTDERDEIEAAMNRLLDGTRLRSTGSSPWSPWLSRQASNGTSSPHKHTDLRDRFYARVKPTTASPPTKPRCMSRTPDYAAGSITCAPERDEYKRAADALARALNILTIETDTLRRQVSHLRERSGPTPLAQSREDCFVLAVGDVWP